MILYRICVITDPCTLIFFLVRGHNVSELKLSASSNIAILEHYDTSFSNHYDFLFLLLELPVQTCLDLYCQRSCSIRQR